MTNLRPELTDHLRQRLQAFAEGFRRNLALIGPPGSGKTFQLQQLLAQPPARMTLIYCPLYRETSRGFLTRFLCALLHAGLPPPPLVEKKADTHEGHTNQALEALLQRAEAQLPKTAAAIRPIEPLLARRLHGEAFNRALDTIPILIEERGLPCVLMLDEFLFLEDLGFVHAFHELGKRVMTWSSTLFLLTSSSSYRARTILRERLQLLFGQFELLTLDAPDPQHAAAWVSHELRGLRGARTMGPFLIRWLGAYPWYLALFLKRLRELAAIRHATELTEGLFFHAAWDLLGSAEGTLHQWCISRTEGLAHARVGIRAMEALIQIANGARTTTDIGTRIGRGGLPGALQLLVDHDLAQRNGTCWVVSDPILRCWLSTVVRGQRADTPLTSVDLAQRFEQCLRALWTQWVEEHDLSLSQQVAGLFAKFREETVSLDSKTGRLPAFQSIRAHEANGPGGGIYLVAEGEGKRWCASVHEGAMDEQGIARFEAFCRTQSPKPGRKVVITRAGMGENARLLAKSANMWVWGRTDLHLLMELYGRI